MKRIFLSALGLGLLLASLKAQDKLPDSTGYKSRRLKLDEVNLVSSYYAQNGDHAVVTGGKGSEKLHDISNVIDVNFIRYDKQKRKQTLAAELGVDYYTSASSDLIDLKANSSASHEDARTYPSVNYTIENEQKGISIGAGIAYSVETDYESRGINIFLSKKTKNKNGEFTAKLQSYFDEVEIIKPIELRTTGPGQYSDYPKIARNTYAASFTYSQVINQRLQVMLLADVVTQKGYLSLPFHRVYFADSSVHQEHLPANKFKIPLGLRVNYFLGDKIIIKAYYRFYYDDYRLISHTADFEVPVKITPFFSISPFYRFYYQSAIKYFSPYRSHTVNDKYYTSNFDMATFNSNFYGTGIRFAPPKGLFGNQHFAMIELRYGHYAKNINLNSDIISMNLKFRE